MKIESWEDRSGNSTLGPNSFGFVYFSDGVRVGYSHAEDHLPVWQPRTNGGGKYQEASTEQFSAAIEFLYNRGVLSNEDIDKINQAASV